MNNTVGTTGLQARGARVVVRALLRGGWLLRRALLIAIIAALTIPAMLLVAEELAALLSGRWTTAGAQVESAMLFAFAARDRRWRAIEPAALAGAHAVGKRDNAASRRPVLLVHGLDEPGSIWVEMASALTDADRTPIRVVYKNDTAAHLAGLSFRATLESLRAAGVAEVDIIAHSMGGLVAWDALAPPAPDADEHDSQERPLPRVRRLILIAAPVLGSPLSYLRPFAEAREQLVRLVSPRLRFRAAGFLRDGAGHASLDLAPFSPFLSHLAARGRPRAEWIGAIAASLAPLNENADPGSLAAMIGDGVAPTFACTPTWADETRLIRGGHRFILHPLSASAGTRARQPPPAVALALKMLAGR